MLLDAGLPPPFIKTLWAYMITVGHLDRPGDSSTLSPLTTASLPSPHWSLAINSQAPAVRKTASWGLALPTTGVTGHSLTQPLLCSGGARIDRWAERGPASAASCHHASSQPLSPLLQPAGLRPSSWPHSDPGLHARQMGPRTASQPCTA